MSRNLSAWTRFAAPQILFSLVATMASSQPSARAATETAVRATAESFLRFAQSGQAPGRGHSPDEVERRMNDPSLHPFFERLSRAHATVNITLRTCGSETIGLTVRTGPLSSTTEIGVNLSSRMPIYAFRETRTGHQIVLDYNTLTVHVREGANIFGREKRYELSFERWIQRAASPGSDSAFRRLSSLGFVTMSAIHNNLPLIAAAACRPFLETYRERALDEADSALDAEPIGISI